jgi:hypothetical protein
MWSSGRFGVCRRDRRRRSLHRCRRRLSCRRGRRRFRRWRGRRRLLARGSRSSRRRRARCGRRRGRRRDGSTPRRKQRGWVDIRLRLASPDAEVHVRDGELGLSGRPAGGDDVPLFDTGALPYAERSEVRERRSVSVAGHDRHGQAVRRNAARERHDARGRSAHGVRAAERDVDSPVLTGRVCVGSNGEAAEDLAVCGPGPGPGGRARNERARDREANAERGARCLVSEHDTDRSARDRRRQCD